MSERPTLKGDLISFALLALCAATVVILIFVVAPWLWSHRP